MVSTLKVNKIQIPNSDSDVISLDASTGNITIPKPVTFSGTVSGSNIFHEKLLEADIAAGTSDYSVDETYINSSFDEYRIYFNAKNSNDNVDLRCQLLLTTSATGAGSIISGNYYSYETSAMGGATYGANNGSSYATISPITSGNGTGEGIQFEGVLVNVNDTTQCTVMNGLGSNITTNGATGGFNFHVAIGSPVTYGAYYCRGFKLYFGAGTFSGKIRVYGIK